MVLPLRSAGFSMPRVLAHHELHEAATAEHADDLHRHAVAAHHDRAVGDDAAERRVAGADLLGHVDAAAADRELDVEARFLEVALALRQPDRPERRQDRRRRKQIGDLLRRLGRGLKRSADPSRRRRPMQATGGETASRGHRFPLEQARWHQTSANVTANDPRVPPSARTSGAAPYRDRILRAARPRVEPCRT